jgi:hypothetical protein
MVLVWKAMAITKLITPLQTTGKIIMDEELACISPLMHQHIIPSATDRFAHSKPASGIA